MMPESNSSRDRAKAALLVQRLEQHPELCDRLEAILQIVEDAQRDCTRADEAEEKVIEQVRLLGRASLQAWAERKQELIRSQYDQHRDLSHKEKKGSGGTPPLAR